METTGWTFNARRTGQESQSYLTLTLKRSTTLILGAFLGLLGVLGAEDVLYQPIGPFGTLNNADDPIVIPAEKAADLLNVEITPGGRSVKKREGFATAHTLTITTSPVHGTHYFYDSNGNDVAIVFHDTIMSASISGGSIANVFTNGPNGATYQCVDSQGFAYCANTLRSAIVKTNGSTSSNLTGFTSTGTLVAVTPERLVQSGFSGSPNDIAFSKANDFTTWTVGGNATDPISFTVTAPGPKITHITYAFDRIVWFKATSFGYVLIGNQANHEDWQIVTVDNDLGTLDNTSVFREGILYFRGNDSHLYAFDGSNLRKLTRDIQTTISASQSRASNSWTQTSQSDWASGYDITSIYIDTATSSGNVQMTFPDSFGSFRDGTGGTKGVWTSYCQQSSVACSTNVASSSGVLTFTSTTGVVGQDQMIRSQLILNNYKVGTTFYFALSTVTTSSNLVFSFGISSYSVNTPITSALFNDQFFFDFKSTMSSTIYLSRVKNTNDGTICLSNCQTGNSSLTDGISIYVATTVYQVSIGTSVIKSGSHSYTNNRIYLYFDFFWGNAGTGIASIDTFGVAPQTATYYSAVKNAPSLTSWDSFSATKVDNGGSQSFFIRSSTNSIQVNSSTPSWTSISIGALPTISTGTYFQIRDDFSITLATQSPALNDFTQNWFEGAATDKSYATYHRDAIWWSVASGAGATSNNKILYYDLLNDGMTLYDIASNGFYVKSQSLYFGSATSGYVFKYGGVNNDNGSAINSYWKSKDYVFGSPFTDKEFTNISLAAQTVSNSSMTVTYVVNGSSSTSYTVPLGSSYSFVKKNNNLPQGKIGQTFNIQIGNNASDQFYEAYGLQVGYRVKSWRPE